MQKQPNSRHCFVCGVENRGGIRARFYDREDGEVEARFVATAEHQGYPGRLHGGVASGVLDETIGRAINNGSEDGDGTVWGVALELTVRFHRPIPLEVELSARGRLTRERSRVFEGTGEILLPDGEVAVSAKGRYLKMQLDRIAEGADPDELGWRVYPDDDAV